MPFVVLSYHPCIIHTVHVASLKRKGIRRLCRMGRPFFRKGRRWARTGPASTLLIEDVPGKGCLGLFLPGRKSSLGVF